MRGEQRERSARQTGPGTVSPSGSDEEHSPSSSDQEPGSGPGLVALDRSRGFWAVMPKDPDWFSGHLWWVAVTAAAGVLVGVLRRVFRLPAKLPGTMKELRDERVEPSTVLQAVAVSLVSLVGGASLGPEDALGKMGGGRDVGVGAAKAR